MVERRSPTPSFVGSNPTDSHSIPPSVHFNSRSPYGERPCGPLPASNQMRFQLTLPLRGATTRCRRHRQPRIVSTHAPLAGSDPTAASPPIAPHGFQLTLPLRGATAAPVIRIADHIVSTHAPLAGSDCRPAPHHKKEGSFNSRSPCGERPDCR